MEFFFDRLLRKLALHVVTLLDEQAAKAAILRELSGFVDATSVNDVLLVTFSGHGAEIENPYAHNGYNETSCPSTRSTYSTSKLETYCASLQATTFA